MSSYLREIKTARIDATRLTVELTDDSTFTVPLRFYPTLQLATDDELYEGYGREITPRIAPA